MEEAEERPLVEEVKRRLDLITGTPGAVLKYDTNGDGVLDSTEWEMLRTLVEAEIVRERSGSLEEDAEEEVWSIEEELLDPHVDLPVLEVIDQRYEVLREIGRGSQGKTLLARRREDRHYVAVKELRFAQLDSWKSLELFEREAEVLERIEHERIPSFVDAFHVDLEGEPARFFLVQSFVSGSSLDISLARGERTNEPQLLEFAAGVLDVLVYLHELVPPVIHRDIKPANLIHKPDDTYALVDFGGAQVIMQGDTGGSTIIGTTGYMPPEQLSGRACAGSDLYALGATMVHLATHVAPSQLPTARLKLQWRDRTNLSQPVADFIDRLIEPVAEDRFTSARDAQQRARALLRGTTTALAEVPQTSSSVAALGRQERPFFQAEIHRRRTQDGTAVVLNLTGEGTFHKDVAVMVLVMSALAAVFVSVTLGFGMAIVFIAVLLFHSSESDREELHIFPDGSFRVMKEREQQITGVLVGCDIVPGALLLRTDDGRRHSVGAAVPEEVRTWAAGEVLQELNPENGCHSDS